MILSKFISKKQNEAKEYLKSIGKQPYSPQYGEELEKAWLVFADVLLSVKKTSSAKGLLDRCLKYNSSCGKAEELLGFIAEKDSNLIQAVGHYKRAWELFNQNSPTVGYRLAHCYLELEDHVNCVSICKTILKKQKNNEDIQKILAKSLPELRA